MKSDKYDKAAVENVEQELARVNQRFPSKCKTPMTVGYHLERDVSPELTSDGVQRYQDIGVIRWQGLSGCQKEQQLSPHPDQSPHDHQCPQC